MEGLETRQLMAANFSDSFSGYLGAGLDPAGTSGRLASNNYAVTMGTTVVAFGGSSTATGVAGGDRTNAPGNNVQTGLQAFSVGGVSTGTDKMLGIQPTGSTFQSATNGNITLRVQNDGTAATTASIGYEVYVNNDQARSNSLMLSFSTDNVTYTPVPAATYTSPAAADASGLVLATTVSQSGISVAVPANGFLYVRWTGADAGGSGTRDEFGIDDVSVVLTGSPAAPEIDVQGNGNSIADGDTSPSVLDDTDFGSAVVGGSNITKTFTILNTGTGSLDLTGSPLIAISGSPDFTVTTQPAIDPIAAAGSTTFVVTFDPTTVGTQTATITIASDDANENPYNFDIQGIVNASAIPDINIQGNAVNIVDGDTTPDVVDGTAFGSAVVGTSPITKTFTIQNLGSGPLDLTGSPLVAITGSSDFTISTQPAADPIAAAGSTTFVITFTPSTLGLQTASISIASDDSDENPYNFDVNGTVLAAVAEANVQGNLLSIVDGDVTPSLADHTEFPSTLVGGTSTRTFTIQNSGTVNLTLGTFTSSNPLFTIPSPPAGPVAPGGSVTFNVTFSPTAAGTQASTISFGNNDGDENPYDFDVSGIAVAPTPLYINEIMFNPSGTDTPNEYVEIRGGANATIPAGTYLVGIEGDTTGAGDVQTIFNLGGLTLGSNGYLLIRQSGNSYTVDSNATTITGTGTGFAGAAGFQADSSGTEIENASVSFLLIQAGTAPTLTDDIDSDNNGTPDGTVFSGWSLLDQVAVLDNVADTSYAAITFSVNGTGTVPLGSVVVNTSTNTANYVGRIGNSTGSTAADWVGGGLTALGTPVEWAFDRSQTFPSTLAGARIDDLGSSNSFTPSGVTITESGTTDIAEGGATDTYSVVLNTQPNGNVTVTVTPSSQLNLGAGQGTAISLNFTNANWNTPQIVNVTAVDDVLVEGLHTGAITHTITTGTLDYLGLPIASVTANITDNDTVPVPEVNVLGNATTIVDGDTTPDVGDHTSFPTTPIGNSSTRTYTIQNTGAGSLTLGAFSSSNGVFTIVNAPAGPIGAGSSATFDVVFTPTALGSAIATISFINDDSDENPYNFDVEGTGVAAAAPEANVRGNAISIADGDLTPASADHTAFGAVRIGTTFTRTFTIENTGSANLTLGAFSSTNPLFTIPSPPIGPIAPAASVTFDVVFSPTAGSVQSSTISFVNSDGDENPYNFDVTGQGFELYINEIMFNPSGTDAPNEYVEFRGTPGVTIPNGTYFIAIEGDPGTSNPGDVNSIFNLSGLTIGSNGYLVLLQGGSTYTVDDDATTVAGTGTGWTGVAGFDADGTATDIENASASFFLVSTALVPTDASDIDTNNDSVADGAFFASWSILDQIAVVDAATDTSYASLTFAISGAAIVPSGGIIIDSGANTSNYFGRIGDSTGSTAADWLGGGLTALVSPVAWALNRAETFPSSLAGARIDDLGASNSFAPSGVTITESGTTDVTEGGATDSYTVILNTQPIANVTVTVTPAAQVDLGTGAGTAIALVFTPVNWNIPQSVTVSAVDDATVEGSHNGLIAHTITVGSLDYVGLTIPSVTANITDNDVLANPTVTITSGDVVYSNSVYVATASVTGFNAPDPTASLTFEFYSDAGGATIIAAPENVGTYYVRASTTANAGNNAAQSAITMFQITPFALTASGTADSKVYDATTAATVTVILNGVFIGDTVTGSASGAFGNKNVGNGKTVTIGTVSLTGTDAANYTVGAVPDTTANITPASITSITSITANNKVFDGNTTATLVTSGATFNGRLGSDVLTVATATGNFVDSSVGNGKTVNITGLTLGGADAGNYSLLSTTATTTANILAAGSVVNTQLFYRALGNGGIGNATNPTTRIDPNKLALQPGQTEASIEAAPGGTANFIRYYSGFIAGINGLVVDIANTVGIPTASDFQFRTWNGISGSPATSFVLTTATPTVTNLGLVGQGGSRRMKIEFLDNAIKNTWLQVTVLANPATSGLTAPRVFYFGNAAGDVGVGNSQSVATGNFWQVTVTGTDGSAVLANQTAPGGAAISNNFDVGKNLGVSGTDRTQVLSQPQGQVLRFFNAPSAPPAMMMSSGDSGSALLAPMFSSPSIVTKRIGLVDQFFEEFGEDV